MIVIDNNLYQSGTTIIIDQHMVYYFNTSAYNTDVGIVNLTWSFQYDGRTVALYGSNPRFTFDIPGNYTITLTLTDELGNVISDTFILTVLPIDDEDNDEDDDGDGVPDVDDAFPLDPNEWVDTDGDGIGDNTDLDDDGDNVTDILDDFPLDPYRWDKGDDDSSDDDKAGDEDDDEDSCCG